MDFDLRDKVAIVTGSSRGLGLASARALAAEGCCVTLCARTDKTLQEAARHVAKPAGGTERVLALVADVSRADDVQMIVDRTAGTFGGIDILVNNVGTARGVNLMDTSDEE